MKITMLVEMSGTRNGQPWPPRGKVAELPTAEAAHLVAAGIAEQAGEVETAAAPPAETAAVPESEKPSPPAEEKRGRGRPRMPRDDKGAIVRE